jgi:hypothetical protein
MMSGGSSSGKALTVQETWEGRYEQLMEQFASDMCLYMRWAGGGPLGGLGAATHPAGQPTAVRTTHVPTELAAVIL